MTAQYTSDLQIKEEVAELQNQLEMSNIKLKDLATMGTLITSIHDLDTILSVVMEMSIRMVDAEVGLLLLEQNDELLSRVTWGIDDSIIRNFIYLDGQNIAEFCFNKQEPVILNKKQDDFDFGPTVTSIMALPIKSRAKCHGVMVVINKNSTAYLNDDDKDNLEMLVNFASVAIDNAVLLKESLQKQKIEQELAIAKQIQQAILPDGEVSFPGVDIGTFYRPARFVSGDFYDIYKVNETEFVMLVGDVSNKGVPAAIVMSAATAIIRSKLMRSPEINPSLLMSDLNNTLCNGVTKDNDMFATLFIARINLDDMSMTYCNAGHNPPFFWDSQKGEVIELPSGGPFVGQFDGVPYKEGALKINIGDRLLVYTDGITEAEDIHQGQFGVERLMQAFLNNAEGSSDEFCHQTVQWLDRFTKGASEEPFDDITLLKIAITKDSDEEESV